MFHPIVLIILDASLRPARKAILIQDMNALGLIILAPLRDNPVRATAILRAAIIDSSYRGSFQSGEVSVGALLIRLATVTPRIIASPSWRADLTPAKAASAEDALKASRSALVDDLSCLVSIGRSSAHACGSARGRVTRLLAEVCGGGWWKARRPAQQHLAEAPHRNASHSPCGSPAGICSTQRLRSSSHERCLMMSC